MEAAMLKREPVTITGKSKIDLNATVRYGDIEGLFPICKWGLPEVISDDLREALQGFVCLCLNPYRSIWDHCQDRNSHPITKSTMENI
jgi:hypothetical protein